MCLAPSPFTTQHDWNAPYGISLNRLTAWHLGRCLKKRLAAREEGKLSHNAVDLLVTGCEVMFASSPRIVLFLLCSVVTACPVCACACVCVCRIIVIA